MQPHSQISSKELHRLIRNSEIKWAGNARLKIYGTLHCKSGKRMKRTNRVFFATKSEATELGFRPCGNCMRSQPRSGTS
jgi:methylphosphotriester-DNA--protein-cysteine methyltransferase